MVDVADWEMVRPNDLKPGQYVLHRGDEAKVKRIDVGHSKDHLVIRLHGHPPIRCLWDEPVRRVRGSREG